MNIKNNNEYQKDLINDVKLIAKDLLPKEQQNLTNFNIVERQSVGGEDIESKEFDVFFNINEKQHVITAFTDKETGELVFDSKVYKVNETEAGDEKTEVQPNDMGDEAANKPPEAQKNTEVNQNVDQSSSEVEENENDAEEDDLKPENETETEPEIKQQVTETETEKEEENQEDQSEESEDYVKIHRSELDKYIQDSVSKYLLDQDKTDNKESEPDQHSEDSQKEDITENDVDEDEEPDDESNEDDSSSDQNLETAKNENDEGLQNNNPESESTYVRALKRYKY